MTKDKKGLKVMPNSKTRHDLANSPKEHEKMRTNLFARLEHLYKTMLDEDRFSILGTLEFDIVDQIDNKQARVAKLVGKNVLVKVNAVQLPDEALRYVIAHEIAHNYTKTHTEKFWKTLESIYPKFERGKKLLEKHQDILK